MSADLHQLIATYGYWLMAFGALIEGETFLIAGGIAAQQGMLHLPGLILLALVGSTIHDVAFFALGRYGGKKILDRKPHFKAKTEGILKLFDRYGVWLIILLRFAYGLRTMIPTVLGMSPISTKKFIFFDILGGIIWSCCFILGGYYIGKGFTLFWHQFNHIEHWLWRGLTIALVAILIAVCTWLILRYCKRKKTNA